MSENDPALRIGVLEAALEHVSMEITDALVWLPMNGPRAADAVRTRGILTNARQHIADTLARIDGRGARQPEGS